VTAGRSDQEISVLFEELAGGSADAARLVACLYDELRALAEKFFRGERGGHTLQPTALVHEAYLRLARDGKVRWRSRAEFLGWAARVMRQVLIQHARSRKRKKRGGGAERVALDDVVVSFEECSGDLEAVNAAVDELTRLDERKGRVVELRFFGGLSLPDIARVLGASQATVERDWRFARAWLKKALEG
jgi:RNA polymerase sigma factor (TIGR02999 family)